MKFSLYAQSMKVTVLEKYEICNLLDNDTDAIMPRCHEPATSWF